MCVREICGPEKDLPRKKIKVNVTGWHIRSGYKRSCQFCPTNIALMEMINCDVSTNFDAVRLSTYENNQGKIALVIPHSAELYKWIENFDYAREVKPFQYEIEIPEKYIREKPLNLEQSMGEKCDIKKPSLWNTFWRWMIPYKK